VWGQWTLLLLVCILLAFMLVLILLKWTFFFNFFLLSLRNASIELLQALLSFFPFIKLCIYYIIKASNYDIVQIQFFLFSVPLWEKFLHNIFAKMNVENQEQELCTSTSNELWFIYMCMPRALLIINNPITQKLQAY
jgi:hypothetical protein